MKNLKVAVVAANGRVGQLVVEETTRRGMDVTAVVRGENKTAAEKSLVTDALELTAADLAGFDAVVDAAGGWTPETIPAITNVAVHLADCVAGTSTRLVVVGGAGSLFVNPEHTATVDQGPDFPEDWKPLSAAHGAALANLRGRSDDTFVEDEGWHAAAARYQDFVRRHRGSRLLLLEIGVGANTPIIIKYPFWRMAAENPRATYVCVNPGEAMAPTEIAERSVLLDLGRRRQLGRCANNRSMPVVRRLNVLIRIGRYWSH